MVKRRDLVGEIKEAGFENEGGANHDKFVHPDGRVTVVPRHREIGERLADEIRKQAGIGKRK